MHWNIARTFFAAAATFFSHAALAQDDPQPTVTGGGYSYTPDPFGGAGILQTPSGQTYANPTFGGGFEGVAPDGSSVQYTPEGPGGGEIETTPPANESGDSGSDEGNNGK
jgi:hypothetical protein